MVLLCGIECCPQLRGIQGPQLDRSCAQLRCEARYSTRQFYLHHTRLIAKAAVIHDAMGIRVQVQGLRQRVCAAHAVAGGWP